MAKDYKHRFQSKKPRKLTKNQSASFGLFKSMLVSAAIMVVVLLILMAINAQLKKNTNNLVATTPIIHNELKQPKQTLETAKVEKAMPTEPPTPQFDFYTILPEKDIVVPDYEIKMRAREESAGKVSGKQYTMQAGSFKSAVEAEQLIAKLATMGIEAKVQKAKVGNVIWYRVKLGSYTQMSSISTLRTRLRQNGIDVVVTEIDN